jgi:hypothetical protein
VWRARSRALILRAVVNNAIEIRRLHRAAVLAGRRLKKRSVVFSCAQSAQRVL